MGARTSLSSQDEDDMAGIEKLVIGMADLLDAEDGGDSLCDGSDHAGHFPTFIHEELGSVCDVRKPKNLMALSLTTGSTRRQSEAMSGQRCIERQRDASK